LVLFEAIWSKDGTRHTREKGLLIQDNPTVFDVLGIFQKQKVTPTIKLVTYLAEAKNGIRKKGYKLETSYLCIIQTPQHHMKLTTYFTGKC